MAFRDNVENDVEESVGALESEEPELKSRCFHLLGIQSW